jgi:hypothetical protein
MPLPGGLDVAFVGTNTTQDIRPATHSEFNWRYSLFGAFGCGCFCPDYGTKGAFVIAGSGGHGAPPNLGAAIFDYADLTWHFLPNSNGVTPIDNTGDTTDYLETDTTGDPFFDLTGSVVPAPGHLYATQAPIPAALAAGGNGGVAIISRAAISTSSVPSGAAHAFNLTSGAWSHLTAGISPVRDFEYTAIYDATRSRYWLLRQDYWAQQHVDYLDTTDWTWKTSTSFDWPSSPGTNYTTFCLDDARGLMLSFRGTTMSAWDLNNQAAGWRAITVTGVLPDATQCPWVYFPGTDSFYFVPQTGGTTLYKLTPPAGGADPFANAWTVTTLTLAHAVPNYTDGNGVATAPYHAFHYVPALGLLARITGQVNATTAGQEVALINPVASATYDEALAEAGGAADALALSFAVLGTATEAAAAADGLASVLAALNAATATGAAADALAPVLAVLNTLADGGAAADVSLATLVAAASTTGAANAQDSAAAISVAATALAEAANAAESIVGMLSTLSALADAADAADSTAGNVGGATYDLLLVEAANAVEAAVGLLASLVSAVEAGEAVDVVSEFAALAGATTEAAAAADALTALALLGVLLDEAAVASDSALGGLDNAQAVAEAASAAVTLLDSTGLVKLVASLALRLNAQRASRILRASALPTVH